MFLLQIKIPQDKFVFNFIRNYISKIFNKKKYKIKLKIGK